LENVDGDSIPCLSQELDGGRFVNCDGRIVGAMHIEQSSTSFRAQPVSEDRRREEGVRNRAPVPRLGDDEDEISFCRQWLKKCETLSSRRKYLTDR
jgi:hypothetical protein